MNIFFCKSPILGFFGLMPTLGHSKFWILADVILVIMVMTRDEYLSRGDQKLRSRDDVN